ncbi:MAG: hypothetical protein HC883_02070 [Bdellovibrionaceae bacterium]|nr:hypothetical protein [Pseudobdellovibrionaceae bacterium]
MMQVKQAIKRLSDPTEVKETLKRRKIDPLEKILDMLPNMSQGAQLRVFMELMPYRYPDMKSAEPVVENPYLDMSDDEKLKILKDMVAEMEKDEP